MNILVTGGAGFIGSHLCEALISKGHNLTVLDDLSSGNIKNLSSCIDLIDFKECKIEEFDFKNMDNIELVVHLAAQTSVPLSIKDFKESSSANLLNTLNIIDFCKSNNASFVYASSAAVYGNLDIGDDENNNFDLLSPYAVDKCAMESYAEVAYHLYKVPSIGLRFFNVYGPRQDPTNSYSGVISIFCNRLIENKDLIINGGYQTRDFIFVKDAVDALVRSINKVSYETCCERINTLTGQTVTIDDVANILIKATGSKVNKIYKELKAGDPKKSNGTSNKLKNILNMNPDSMTPIKKGLIKTIESMKK